MHATRHPAYEQSTTDRQNQQKNIIA